MTSSEGQAGRPTGLASLFPDRSALEHRWGREPLLVRAGERPSGVAVLDIDAVDELLSTRGLRTPFVRVAKGGRTLSDRAFTRPAGVGATIGDQVADDDLLVVGNRGINSLTGRLLGSVPADVARQSDCDVMIVHTVN